MMHAGFGAMRLIGAALLGIGLLPPVAEAAASDLTPDEVRAVYVDGGMVASTPTYSTDGVAMFSVQRAGELNPAHPALRVFVYLSAESAADEHRLAHARDEARRNATLAYSDDVGPQLLLGYGPSLWRGNVALVQVAPSDDVGAHAQEIECGIDGVAITPQPRTTVTPGYQAALDNLLGGGTRASQ